MIELTFTRKNFDFDYSERANKKPCRVWTYTKGFSQVLEFIASFIFHPFYCV